MVTSARLVVNPGGRVVAEARRTFTQLSLFGYQVDAVIVNRVLPDGWRDPWFDRWRATHAEHLDTVPATSPRPRPVLDVGLRRRQGGCAHRAGRRAVVRPRPHDRLVERRPLRLERLGGDDYELSIELPFVDRPRSRCRAAVTSSSSPSGPNGGRCRCPSRSAGARVISAAVADGAPAGPVLRTREDGGVNHAGGPSS